jgi:hypothetical protein
MNIQAWPLKRCAVIVISLLSVVGIVTGVVAGMRRGSGMQVRFNKRDLPEHGVHIITSVDPSFEATASKYFKNKAPETFKPFSVFIRNAGDRLIVGYALTWQFVRTDGKVIGQTTHYSEPGILEGNEIPKDPAFKHTTAIEPGEARCFSWDSQISEDAANSSGGQDIYLPGQSQTSLTNDASAITARLELELSKATDLTVSLDGVFFDDGSFVGSNATGFFEQLKATVSAKVDLLREVAAGTQQGSADQALESIKTESLKPDVVLGPKPSPDDYYKFYRKLFAAEITNMTSVHGKERMVSHLTDSYRRARTLRKQ